jgi:hypothetical protein
MPWVQIGSYYKTSLPQCRGRNSHCVFGWIIDSQLKILDIKQARLRARAVTMLERTNKSLGQRGCDEVPHSWARGADLDIAYFRVALGAARTTKLSRKRLSVTHDDGYSCLTGRKQNSALLSALVSFWR